MISMDYRRRLVLALICEFLAYEIVKTAEILEKNGLSFQYF